MQQLVKFQLNTPPNVTRDMKIELVNEVSGKVTRANPFLDGTVSLRNIEPGAYRVKVSHPNLLGDLIDKRIRVFDGRPTLVPLQVPANIFENAAIRDVPDADLGPAQQKLADASEDAEKLAHKRAGEPIFADDWNRVAAVVADVARSTGEAVTLVSPKGHDHPELVEKLDEVQRNLQKFYDVFASTLVQIQRQIQEMALRQQVEDALDDAQVTDEGKRRDVLKVVDDLSLAREDNSGVYTNAMRRVGEKLALKVNQISEERPEPDEPAKLKNLAATSVYMANLAPVQTFEAELATHKKVERQSGGAGLQRAISYQAQPKQRGGL